ncbi:hypothetical protein SUGI_0468320 [Cryptomeria japonica]|uniref:uncharacterized protein LOC131042695 n=1 Tax=Cryptomeria japonica TaxID=3369 RepID=UPI0024089B13|nr:uncharacterized protein LOC131042695 [Cryptomeria japonica]GLJ24510.1 hypothetical protein SUGI_0468320 [Cryptomeria japonica]
MARQKKQKKQQLSSCDSSGYEGDDEGHGSRLISPTLFRITTFINPFDETVQELRPCDRRLSSTGNFQPDMDAHIANTVEVEHEAPPPLKFIPPNDNAQNSSGFVHKFTHSPTIIMGQENHGDGDNTAVKNNGIRVYDNKLKRCMRAKVPLYSRVAKRMKEFIGVHYYKRTNRWEAYMWLNHLERQLWFGQHFIPEAAARTSDKAQLVLRKDFEIRLNYTQDDYDMDFIREWKDLALEDLEKMLREQAKDYSEGCTVGLKDTAANLLRRQIIEFRESIERRKKII